MIYNTIKIRRIYNLMTFKIYPLQEYEKWFQTQTEKSKLQIIKRLNAIEQDGHFGHTNILGDDLFELKFNDGRRIYYTILPLSNVLLILGGNKNGQDSDIRKAKNSLQRAKENKQKRSKSGT